MSFTQDHLEQDIAQDSISLGGGGRKRSSRRRQKLRSRKYNEQDRSGPRVRTRTRTADRSYGHPSENGNHGTQTYLNKSKFSRHWGGQYDTVAPGYGSPEKGQVVSVNYAPVMLSISEQLTTGQSTNNQVYTF